MNNFCITCRHRQIPSSLKEKYNKYCFNLFEECPMSDENICGCTSKYMDVNWRRFLTLLKRKEALTEEEKELLKNLG